MRILVDTCVVIDFLRGFAPAVAFFSAMTTQPAISTITVAELYAGAKNKKTKHAVKEIIDSFLAIEVDEAIATKGGEWFHSLLYAHLKKLSHAVVHTGRYILVSFTCKLQQVCRKQGLKCDLFSSL